jgi:hypothetical protein
MTFVVGPELEGRQEFGRHAPVVPLVGIADHGAQRRAVGRPSGFPLLDQIAQGLLANHRKDDLAHHAVRLGQCGIGQFEQQVLLAADALDVIEQFTFDLAFGAGTDAVDRLDQQVDQIVGEAARAQIDKRGKPGDSRRIGMPAKFMRSLDCHSPPAALQIAWRSVIEQIGWKVDTTDQFQLRQFLLHAGEAGPPRIAAQRQERRRRAARGVFTLGRAQQLVKTFADRRRQSSVDIGVKAFLMRTKRCARNALYTFDTRRFNRQFTASGFQSFDDRRNLAAGFGSCVISKPFSQGIGVGNGCFSEAVSNANLGAKAFRRSFSEEQSAIGRDSYLNLSRQGGDIQRLQIGWPAWEPTVIAEEHQPRCKGESVLSALGHHHGVIAGGQRLQRKFTKALVAHGAITSVYATLATTRESLPLDA